MDPLSVTDGFLFFFFLFYIFYRALRDGRGTKRHTKRETNEKNTTTDDEKFDRVRLRYDCLPVGVAGGNGGHAPPPTFVLFMY